MTLDGRTQRWELIAASVLTLSICFTYAITSNLWELWFDWQPFNDHKIAMWDSLKGVLLADYSLLQDYLEYHNSNGSMRPFVLLISFSLFISFSLSIYISKLLFYVDGGVDRKHHIEGPLLRVGKRAKRHCRKMRFKQSQSKSACISLHPWIYIPSKQLQGNILALGSQGSGKSTVIKPLVDCLKRNSFRLFIYDAKQEYTQIFFSESTILVNPVDARSYYWDISKDVTTEESAQNIAESFISSSHGDRYWADGARLIFTGILVSLIRTNTPWDWSDIQNKLELDLFSLKELLAKFFPQAEKFVEEESKTTQGFLTLITTQLSWINLVAKHWPTNSKNKFSIKAWADGAYGNREIIFPNIPQYSQLSAPLCSAALAVLSEHILSKPDTNEETWLVLDELADLPKTNSLNRWLSQGRSKGARTIAGTQNISQINSVYGKDDAETLISLFSNTITLRTNSSESASKLSKNIGDRVVERKLVTTDHEGKKSVSFQRSEEPTVRAEQIMQLPLPNKKGVTGVLNIAGWNAAYWLTWPYPAFDNKAEGFVAKTENSTSSTEKSRRGSRGRARPC